MAFTPFVFDLHYFTTEKSIVNDRLKALRLRMIACRQPQNLGELQREADVYHIPILDDVFLAFQAELALAPGFA